MYTRPVQGGLYHNFNRGGRIVLLSVFFTSFARPPLSLLSTVLPRSLETRPTLSLPAPWYNQLEGCRRNEVAIYPLPQQRPSKGKSKKTECSAILVTFLQVIAKKLQGFLNWSHSNDCNSISSHLFNCKSLLYRFLLKDMWKWYDIFFSSFCRKV